jgi:hypothetical protein
MKGYIRRCGFGRVSPSPERVPTARSALDIRDTSSVSHSMTGGKTLGTNAQYPPVARTNLPEGLFLNRAASIIKLLFNNDFCY